jgi:lipoteichoic acid synthase
MERVITGMVKTKKKINLLFYFVLSLYFMENILRVCTTGTFLSSSLLLSLIFSFTFALTFYMICSAFKDKVSYIFSLILMGLSAFIFSSQLIYYKVFKIFYTFYSLRNSSQIFEFWRVICTTLMKNFLFIILIFLPFILLVAFGRKKIVFKRIKWTSSLMLVGCIALSHLTGLAAVSIGSRGENSPYNLYFNDNNSAFAVDKLGLITTMRLDLERLTFGWSPTLEVTTPVVLDPPTEESDEEPVQEDIIEEKPVEEKKIDYNIMNIDFTNLISNEKNAVIKDMHNYFESVKPTSKNEYTGKYKDYNLILITAEAFSPYAVREDVTPTLYKMVNEGYNFTNFYNPIWGVSTSDGEYVACTGLIPKSGIWSFEKSGSIYMPLVMGNQLKNLGYKTMAYHNHSYSYYKRNISHPNMGYTYKGLGNGLSVKKTWPESDLEMMEKTIPEYIGSQPFHTYYMTVSGHMLYSFSGNSMAAKNKKQVENLPYSEAGKAYIASQIELDKAMEYLLAKLEEAGIADKTLIALSPDHYPYGLEEKQINELAGHTVEKNFELYKSTFILYTKGMEPVTIDKPCSSLDIIPTLSNMLGLQYDSRLLMGRDIFSDSEPLVVFLDKSFITDKGSYNSKTQEFTPKQGVQIEGDYVSRISSIVNSKFHYSAKILETNYYSKVLRKP